MPASSPNSYVSIAEAAEYLGVHQDSIRRYIARGKLPAFRIGPRNIRIKLADLDALVERIPTAEVGG